jgi:hypothetical protein
MIDVDAKYNRSKAIDISKFNRRFAVPPPDAGAERPASIGNFSPGKDPDLDLRDGEASSVADYASAISRNWQRGVDAFMNIARLCSEANERLTTAQKRELIQALPFGDTAFSKFVGIGTDTRLHAPDIQRLLPPHYTTIYAVTSLTNEELSLAIADKVLHPDMQRAQLLKWRNSHREKVVVASSPEEAESGSTVASPPIDWTQDPVENGAPPSTTSNDSQDNQEELAATPKDTPAPEAVATTAKVASPSAPPLSDEDIPAFLDRRPLSAEDQRLFDVIMAALNSASAVVRERVRAELVRANTSSRADAGIKYRDIQELGYMPGRTKPEVVVQRRRRRPSKVRGFLENSPF